MTKWLPLLAVATLLAAQPAMARSFGEHGGYDVLATETTSETDRGYCGMMEEFAGPGSTRLMLFRYIENPEVVVISITNFNWSAKEDQRYENFTFQFGSYYYERSVLGVEDGIYKGFLAAFPHDDFMPVFARSTVIHVEKDGTEIDRLSLDGTTAATAAFNRCWAYLVADDRAKEREWNKWKDLPIDPFREEG